MAQGAARGAWRNPLVLAVKRGAPPASDKPIAVSDPTPGSDMDGPAILARLGLLPTPMLGVIDTDTVAALVLNGTARAGLLHMTDVRAHPELQVVRTVSPAVQPPIAYAAAVTKLARRPDPAGFVAFLLTDASHCTVGRKRVGDRVVTASDSKPNMCRPTRLPCASRIG